MPVHLNRVLKCLEPILEPKHSPWRSKKHRVLEFRSIENGFYSKIEIEVKWSPKMKDLVLDVPLVWWWNFSIVIHFSINKFRLPKYFWDPKFVLNQKWGKNWLRPTNWSDLIKFLGTKKIILTIINFESKIAFNQKIV